jgi:hypothetical protein
MLGGTVLIDASNLHIGGGVQVASSLIHESLSDEFLARYPWLIQSRVQVSNEVLAGIPEDSLSRSLVHVVNSRPGKWRVTGSGFDVALTVFGPAIRKRVARYEIVGLARPHIVSKTFQVSGIGEHHFKNFLLRCFAKRSDHWIVESSDYDRRMRECVANKPTHVISNTPAAVFYESSRPLKIEEFSGPELRIASVARDYEHKNLRFLPRLGLELEYLLDRPVKFYVTLTDDEYSVKSDEFKKCTVNVGLVTHSELIRMLNFCHASLVCSLMEVFSVTPLESILLGLPTFVSDRDFMRMNYDSAVVYIDPEEAISASLRIRDTLTSKPALALLARDQRRFIDQMLTPKDRAGSYLEVIDRVLNDAF